MFCNCSGECCVCNHSNCCMAGNGNDDYVLASKEELLKRVNDVEYENNRKYIIKTLEEAYGHKVKESELIEFKTKLVIEIPNEMYKRIKIPHCSQGLDPFKDRSAFCKAIRDGEVVEEGNWTTNHYYIMLHGINAYYCSRCKYEIVNADYTNLYNYCPNCGIKMKEDIRRI